MAGEIYSRIAPEGQQSSLFQFLNLKRVFLDAVRQNEIEKIREARKLAAGEPLRQAQIENLQARTKSLTNPRTKSQNFLLPKLEYRPPVQEIPPAVKAGLLMGMRNPEISIGFNKETMTVVNNIKTRQDIEELIANREAYENAGVDVEAVINYFSVKDEE
jgi:hypothetical protein